MANHMKEVANMLGVKLNEEFKVDYGHTRTAVAKITNTGLHIVKTNMTDFTGDLPRATLEWLLGGLCEIKQKPWKPTYDDDRYYCITPDGTVELECWFDDHIDVLLYKLGNCYRTREEAEADRDKWIAFYSSDERIDVLS